MSEANQPKSWADEAEEDEQPTLTKTTWGKQLDTKNENVPETAPERRDEEKQKKDRSEKKKPKEGIDFPQEPPFTAFISNLPYSVTEKELREIFEKDCKIENIRLIEDQTGKRKGYGYMDMADLDSLKNATKMNGITVRDRPAKVDVAKEKGFTYPRRKENTRDRDYRDSRDRDHRSGNSNSYTPQRSKYESKNRSSLSSSEEGVSIPPASDYSGAKVNPFGDAKPRDEAQYLKKKEEERKHRDSVQAETSTTPATSSTPTTATTTTTTTSTSETSPSASPTTTPPPGISHPVVTPPKAERVGGSHNNKRDGSSARDRTLTPEQQKRAGGLGRGGGFGSDRKGNRNDHRNDRPKREPRESGTNSSSSVVNSNMFAALQEEDE